MSMTKEEIIRIRNLGCGNEWPKVWNRQLDELCDIALRQNAPIAEAVREACAQLLDAHGVEGGVIYAERVLMQRRIRALDLSAITNAATAAPVVSTEPSQEDSEARSAAAPTPETDALVGKSELPSFTRLIDHARSLERRLKMAEKERDAALREVEEIRKWLDNNTTWTIADKSPVLAEFAKRVWYHVTNDTESYPFSAVIDTAIDAALERASHEPERGGE